MRLLLQEQGLSVWKAVVNGYNVPDIEPTDPGEISLYESNSKAMYDILGCLT